MEAGASSYLNFMPGIGETVRELDLADYSDEPEVDPVSRYDDNLVARFTEKPLPNTSINIKEIERIQTTWNGVNRIKLTMLPQGKRIPNPGEYVTIYLNGRNVQVLITDVMVNLPEIELRETADGPPRFVPGNPNIDIEGIVQEVRDGWRTTDRERA